MGSQGTVNQTTSCQHKLSKQLVQVIGDVQLCLFYLDMKIDLELSLQGHLFELNTYKAYTVLNN